jgi:SAM-dependent methyltransferase
MTAETTKCRICGSSAHKLGEKPGLKVKRSFSLFRCSACDFCFVIDPETDFACLYDEDYYKGDGADPLVDYAYEVNHFESTIRNYEWQGITEVIEHNWGSVSEKRWLDFGCGPGGLVRYLSNRLGVDAFGFDHGYGAQLAKRQGIKILSEHELSRCEHYFDIITAIEVLEHCLDPLAELMSIKRLLKPGGLFFYTTGNSQPVIERILEWDYFVPEIHISLFQPKCMKIALETCGFKTQEIGFNCGFESIIRYKVLKALRFKTMNRFENLIPWHSISRIIDLKYRLSSFPVGRG